MAFCQILQFATLAENIFLLQTAQTLLPPTCTCSHLMHKEKASPHLQIGTLYLKPMKTLIVGKNVRSLLNCRGISKKQDCINFSRFTTIYPPNFIYFAIFEDFASSRFLREKFSLIWSTRGARMVWGNNNMCQYG